MCRRKATDVDVAVRAAEKLFDEEQLAVNQLSRYESQKKNAKQKRDQEKRDQEKRDQEKGDQEQMPISARK